MSDIFVGNRTIFRYTITDSDGDAVDLSSATKKQIRFRSPHGALYAYDASFTSDGTDGVVEKRFIQPGPKGLWRAQVYVEGVSGFNGYSEIDQFPVLETIG